LGRVRVEGRRVHHESLNGELKRYPVRVLPAGADLREYLSGELNRPFPDPIEPPFRPFLSAEDGCTQLGVVYRHWVADSVSIRLVLREWCRQLADAGPHGRPAVQRSTPAYWDLFGSRCGSIHVEQTLLDLWRAHQRFRTCLKVQSTNSHDYAVKVTLRAAPNGLIGAVKTYAKKQGVTVGDVMMAALVDAAASHIPMQHRPRRRDVAVGNVVDLRPFTNRDLSDTFGLYLGFTHLVFRPADVSDWSRLLRRVHEQSTSRRPTVAQASTVWSAAALGVQRLMRPERLYHFYRKEMPMAAGLSNVNLAGTWADAMHPELIEDYVRISPTGPTAPAVLSTTTLGDRLQLGFTYRQALLTPARADDMLRHFIDRLADASSFPH
jgi:hypothetical protein